MDDRYPTTTELYRENDREALITAQLVADAQIRTGFENLIVLLNTALQPLVRYDVVETLIAELRDLMPRHTLDELEQMAMDQTNDRY